MRYQIDRAAANKLHVEIANEGGMLIWVVYKSPWDYPGKFICRPWRPWGSGAGPMNVHLAADDLQELRGQLPHGVDRMPRNDDDDPVIVETWI
jgi:hypothetical protein